MHQSPVIRVVVSFQVPVRGLAVTACFEIDMPVRVNMEVGMGISVHVADIMAVT